MTHSTSQPSLRQTKRLDEAAAKAVEEFGHAGAPPQGLAHFGTQDGALVIPKAEILPVKGIFNRLGRQPAVARARC